MDKSNIEQLRHISDETSFTLEYMEDRSRTSIMDDALLCRAIIRSLEIIGGASTRLDSRFKEQHVHIECCKSSYMSNWLIHNYMGFNYDIIGNILTDKPQRCNRNWGSIGHGNS